MKRLIHLLISVLLFHFMAIGQATEKVRMPRANSFYSQDHFTHDQKVGTITKSKTVVADFSNSPNKIISNIENPSGTLVMDGDLALKEMEEIINNPQKITFTKNYTEFPYQSGQTTYRIPVTRHSRHHGLTDPHVMMEFNLFVDNCITAKKQIPGLVTLSHNFQLKACEFSAYSSISDMYKPYNTWKLNVGCVFLKRLSDELLCYEHFHRNSIH